MVSIVWFKRDLRLHDHAPLVAACKRSEPIIPLYAIEPDLWRQPDSSFRHWAFIHDCLEDLDGALRQRGSKLIIKTGKICNVFQALKTRYNVTHIYAHEETGNGWTYARDLRVIAWCKAQGVKYQELPNNGVVRRLKSRDDWTRHHRARMQAPQIETPKSVPLPKGITSDPLPPRSGKTLGFTANGEVQRGGRERGLRMLTSFLQGRAAQYRGSLSKPLPAIKNCSRLSPHLTYGTLSMREVFQLCWARLGELKHHGTTPEERKLASGISAMVSRLYWHCHFIQKLEDQPSIEHKCMHAGYEDMREPHHDAERLQAWYHGRTGYPLIDACMRALHATGWLNFRMRAMVTSFASYHLFLDWRRISPLLAGLFTDYEPGIHFSQLQMQSGVTGINTLRIYNPVKQSHDHDADGDFIRKYVPELAALPTEFVHEPWILPPLLATEYKINYPARIVEHKTAVAFARSEISKVRKSEGYRAIAQEVYEKHGSRKRPPSRKRR